MAPPAAADPPARETAATPSQKPSATVSPAPTSSTTAAEGNEDPAVQALRNYLREQALAINAQLSDPGQLPGFLDTLTPAAQEWALPLLRENIGDEMPGPYPVGVRAINRSGPDRVVLELCLQDRGWQQDRSTHRPVNAPHFSMGQAVVVQTAGRWLVDDVTADAGPCGAADVAPERF